MSIRPATLEEIQTTINTPFCSHDVGEKCNQCYDLETYWVESVWNTLIELPKTLFYLRKEIIPLELQGSTFLYDEEMVVIIHETESEMKDWLKSLVHSAALEE